MKTVIKIQTTLPVDGLGKASKKSIKHGWEMEGYLNNKLKFLGYGRIKLTFLEDLRLRFIDDEMLLLKKLINEAVLRETKNKLYISLVDKGELIKKGDVMELKDQRGSSLSFELHNGTRICLRDGEVEIK